MLAMRRRGALPVRMSVFDGKQGLVELFGAGSTDTVDVPKIFNHCFRINRIKKNSFSYKGNIDSKVCLFKIDTGSDVSVVNEKLIRGSKRRYVMKNCFLKYPTGETIPVKYSYCRDKVREVFFEYSDVGREHFR